MLVVRRMTSLPDRRAPLSTAQLCRTVSSGWAGSGGNTGKISQMEGCKYCLPAAIYSALWVWLAACPALPLVSRKNIRSGMGCCSRMWSSSDRSGRKRLEGKCSAALVLVSYLTTPRSVHSALPAAP